ncbi:MAG: glycosyltransferase [Clostridia bacterium]|nr:glycosyltransferase [Clostridia bacterium]
MKFLIQIPQLIFGGAEKVLVSFANDLVKRGHDVEILESYEKGLLLPQFDPRVRFHAICSKEYTRKYYASLQEIRAAKGVEKIPKLCKLAFSKVVGYRKFAEKLAAKYYQDKEYDVAINYLEIESPAFLRQNIHAKKYIQWYHTDVANSADPEETDKMIPEYEKMDAIICVAESARNSFIGRYPNLKEKTHVIYNFFDVDAIRNMGEEPFSYYDNRFVMLSVGRLTAPKKYLRFLNVLARLKADGFSFVWHVLGNGYELEAIQAKITELHLVDCVCLDGVTENPYKYMKNCDLFVLPSGWEGFPTVTVEAKILGCAVLATDVSGIREQIVHGENGWICENSEDGIYDELRTLCCDKSKINVLKNGRNSDIIFKNQAKYDKFMSIIT